MRQRVVCHHRLRAVRDLVPRLALPVPAPVHVLGRFDRGA